MAAARSNAVITQIRNATRRIDYGGVHFLVDPMLADAGAYPGFPRTAVSQLRNPLTPLPSPAEDPINMDAVIVTHTHADHWDEAAQRLIPRAMPIFVQDAADATVIAAQGFFDVRVLGDSVPNLKCAGSERYQLLPASRTTSKNARNASGTARRLG